MKRAIVLVALIGLSSFFTGCVAPLKTPSGRPEIFIKGATKPEVMEQIVLETMNFGYAVQEQTDYSILVVTDADDFSSQMFFGSQFNSTPQKQLRCSLAQTASGVRVMGTFAVVTNPGSGYAKKTDMSKSEGAHQIQAIFEKIRERLEARDQSTTQLPESVEGHAPPANQP